MSVCGVACRIFARLGCLLVPVNRQVLPTVHTLEEAAVQSSPVQSYTPVQGVSVGYKLGPDVSHQGCRPATG